MESNRVEKAESELAATMFRQHEPQYELDSVGRLVRVETETQKVLLSEVTESMWNIRVVEEDDMLRKVGKAWFQYLVRKDYLRKDFAAPYYWVTQNAERVYRLGNLVLHTAHGDVQVERPA